MREIKYRQAIFVKGKFAYFHYWGFLPEGHFASPETNASTIEGAREHSKQFTGLKDKNGKDIYDGDVVCDSQWIDAGDRPPHIVKFGEYQIESYYNIVGFYLADMFGVVCENSFLLEQDTVEVIGNIYANPELLTDSK